MIVALCADVYVLAVYQTMGGHNDVRTLSSMSGRTKRRRSTRRRGVERFIHIAMNAPGTLHHQVRPHGEVPADPVWAAICIAPVPPTRVRRVARSSGSRRRGTPPVAGTIHAYSTTPSDTSGSPRSKSYRAQDERTACGSAPSSSPAGHSVEVSVIGLGKVSSMVSSGYRRSPGTENPD